MEYKYKFNEGERLAIELWDDIVNLYRNVTWGIDDSNSNKTQEIKNKIYESLSLLMCELDNFSEAFENKGYDVHSYIQNFNSGLLKCYQNIRKHNIDLNMFPKFNSDLEDIHKKVIHFKFENE